MEMKEPEPERASPGALFPGSPIVPPAPERTDLAREIGDATGVATGVPEKQLQKERKAPTPLRESLRRLRRDVRAMVSIGVVGLFVLIALIGPPIYQHIGPVYNSPLNGPVPSTVYHSFSHQELTRQDEGPSAQYWLGTDDLGRDILARLMQGMLISITVALLVEVVDILLGVLVGVLAGYFGGWIEQF